MIPYAELMQLRTAEERFAWSSKDAMLYALGVGAGEDPLDTAELAFVYEKNQKVLPTFASVAAWESRVSREKMGLNYLLVVHAEQKIEIHRPLKSEGAVLAVTRVSEAVDKGSKGAIIASETLLRDVADGASVATLTSTIFARGDGGFGGPTEGGEAPHPTPSRGPDEVIELQTRPEQALIYRLSGDRNPLHADPEVARKAGFERPILHGLAVYGMTCRAVLKAWPDIEPELIRVHRARFSAPTLPGDLIRVSLWRDGDTISFEAHAVGRDVVVIRNGQTLLRSARA